MTLHRYYGGGPPTRRNVLAAFAAALIAAAGLSSAARADDPIDPQRMTADSAANLLANPDAEAGTSGWASTGFSAAPYGSSPLVPPASFATANDLGSQLFLASTAGATLTQTVSVAVDPTRYALRIAALLGGSGASADGATLDAQPQDAYGTALGAPIQLGPVTPQDRQGQSTLRVCEAFLNPIPGGTRSVRITISAVGALTGTGSATVDSLHVEAQPLGTAAAATAETFYTHDSLQGPNCFREVPHTIGTHPPVEPPPPARPVKIRLTHILLGRHSLSLRVSTAARVHITLFRKRKATGSRHRIVWSRILTFTRSLSTPGTIERPLRHALPPDGYRIVATARGTRGAFGRVTATCTLHRPHRRT